MSVKRYSWKEIQKRSQGKCTFCPISTYALLDVHRIVPQENGGKYTAKNSVVVCALCHRKIHAGIIEIEGKYTSTAGRYFLYYKEDGVDKVI